MTALVDHGSGQLWVANVGDSRAVLCRAGDAMALSTDHKADRADEVDRIRKAGGMSSCLKTAWPLFDDFVFSIVAPLFVPLCCCCQVS